MKVILYIGHHKVGSSALQQYFAQNSYRLMQNGILYPAVESEGLSYMLRKTRAQSDFAEHIPINAREPHNALAFRLREIHGGHPVPEYHPELPSLRQMVVSMHNQVRMVQPEAILLCSEAFSNLGADTPNGIPHLLRILDWITEGTAELEVYCALRRPDEYVASWHMQRLRFYNPVEPLDWAAIQEYRKHAHFDYRNVLRQWGELCPGATFHIRNYNDILRVGGSIEDFTETVSAQFPSDMLPTGQANLSVPAALYEIIRRSFHAMEAGPARHLFDVLVENADKLALEDSKRVEFYGQDTRDKMYEAFVPVETYLRDLTNQDAFFPDLEDMRTPRPVPFLDATRGALDDILGCKAILSKLTPDLIAYLRDLQSDLASSTK